MTSQSKLDPFSFIVVHGPKTKNPTSLLQKGTTSEGKILGQKRFRQSNQGSCNNNYSFRRKTFWGYLALKASQEVRQRQVILHFASTLLTLKVILEHKYDTE